MAMSYSVAGHPGLTLDAQGNGFDAKCPVCGTINHLRMANPHPDDNFVEVDKVTFTCVGEVDGEPCGYRVEDGQLVGTY